MNCGITTYDRTVCAVVGEVGERTVPWSGDPASYTVRMPSCPHRQPGLGATGGIPAPLPTSGRCCELAQQQKTCLRDVGGDPESHRSARIPVVLSREVSMESLKKPEVSEHPAGRWYHILGIVLDAGYCSESLKEATSNAVGSSAENNQSGWESPGAILKKNSPWKSNPRRFSSH